MNFRTWSGLLFFPAVLLSQTPARYPADAARADLRFLYETLQAAHYDLFARTSKADYDATYECLLAQLTQPLEPRSVYCLLQSFAARAGMAHCSITLPFQEVYAPYVMGGGTVIPFDLTWDASGHRVRHVYGGAAGISPGDRVTAINGRPMTEIMSELTNLVSGDNPALQHTAITLAGFPRLFWLAFGETKTFVLSIDGAGTQPTMAAVPALQFEQSLASERSPMDSSRQLKFLDGTTAYLRPGAFLNNEAPADLTKTATFERGEFTHFIDGAFAEISKRRSRRLIVDLRGNPGGDNSFSDPLVAYFADRPFRFCASFGVRTSAVTKTFWREVADPALASLKTAILARPDGDRFAVDLPYYAPRPPAERFFGKVVVLVNRFTYSNAVTMAALVQDYGFGSIVGEPTADVPTTFAASHQFTLPHTGFTVIYPKARMIRPSGDQSASGIIPDRIVFDDPRTAADEIMDAAVAP